MYSIKIALKYYCKRVVEILSVWYNISRAICTQFWRIESNQIHSNPECYSPTPLYNKKGIRLLKTQGENQWIRYFYPVQYLKKPSPAR